MNTNPHAKRILCYGDSNTWGWIPSSMGKERYNINERWPGILQKKLGSDYEVIEEGLGGRTTMFDDPRPEFPERNGLKSLPPILESHLPLDLVIIMLGTTDTKEMMDVTGKEITEGMQKIIHTIKKFKTLDNTKTPQILIIVPPIVDETATLAKTLFQNGTAKATALTEEYAQLAKKEHVHYLNPTSQVKVDSAEGIHLNAKNHALLAKLIYEKIKKEMA
ncbi:MAG: SGNH/GDSL hydrolase family protein [Candidatus Woesearchaeota archaeon]